MFLDAIEPNHSIQLATVMTEIKNSELLPRQSQHSTSSTTVSCCSSSSASHDDLDSSHSRRLDHVTPGQATTSTAMRVRFDLDEKTTVRNIPNQRLSLSRLEKSQLYYTVKEFRAIRARSQKELDDLEQLEELDFPSFRGLEGIAKHSVKAQHTQDAKRAIILLRNKRGDTNEEEELIRLQQIYDTWSQRCNRIALNNARIDQEEVQEYLSTTHEELLLAKQPTASSDKHGFRSSLLTGAKKRVSRSVRRISNLGQRVKKVSGGTQAAKKGKLVAMAVKNKLQQRRVSCHV